MRTSTEATFVLPIITPSNHIPGWIVSVENQTCTIRGGALGLAMGGDGHARGCFSETVMFGGSETGFGEQAVTDAATAPTRSSVTRVQKGYRSRNMMTAK